MSSWTTNHDLPARARLVVAKAVKATSRTKYGRPVAKVEAEIEARRRVPEVKPNKPKLGNQRWG